MEDPDSRIEWFQNGKCTKIIDKRFEIKLFFTTNADMHEDKYV